MFKTQSRDKTSSNVRNAGSFSGKGIKSWNRKTKSKNSSGKQTSSNKMKLEKTQKIWKWHVYKQWTEMKWGEVKRGKVVKNTPNKIIKSGKLAQLTPIEIARFHSLLLKETRNFLFVWSLHWQNIALRKCDWGTAGQRGQ